MPVPSITGSVTGVYERKSGTNNNGPWSFQDITLADGTGAVARIKAVNYNDLSEYKGKTVTLECYKSSKHGLTGLKKLTEEYKGKTYHKIKMTETAKIIINGENGRAQEARVMDIRDKGQHGGAGDSHVELSPEETGNPIEIVFSGEIMRCCNAFYLIEGRMREEAEQSRLQGFETTPEHLQAKVSSAFIHLDRAGLVSKLDTTPAWSVNAIKKKDVDKNENKEQAKW